MWRLYVNNFAFSERNIWLRIVKRTREKGGEREGEREGGREWEWEWEWKHFSHIRILNTNFSSYQCWFKWIFSFFLKTNWIVFRTVVILSLVLYLFTHVLNTHTHIINHTLIFNTLDAHSLYLIRLTSYNFRLSSKETPKEFCNCWSIFGRAHIYYSSN
jgi:hypothetical protein